MSATRLEHTATHLRQHFDADPGNEKLFRESTRVPLEAPVKLQFDAFGQPQSGFTANISVGGMFVQSCSPRPVGTRLRFELELEAGTEPISGLAEVVWIRVKQHCLEQPAGMGIQFRYLDADSRRRLDAAVADAA